MNLQSIFISNGTGVFILLMLLYVSRTKTLRNRIEDKVFIAMMFGVLGACCMEALSYALDGRVFAGSRILNYVANTYLYTVNLLLPFGVLMYVDLGMYGDPGRICGQYKPQIAIGIVMTSANLINFFVPISYYITEQNVYERRPFSYVYYFVILYYCVTAILMVRRYERENGAKTFFSIHVFLTPILMGAGLQFLFYGLSLAWLSAAIGLTGLFMMQQNESAYIDPLTETYNRQYLNHILSSWEARGVAFCGAMIDIDRFKSINDNYGHSEGDKALRTVSNILTRSRLDGEWVFRFAGDEFIVLKMGKDPADLDLYLTAVEKNILARNAKEHRYELMLSYGVSVFGEGGRDGFIKAMDDKMYEMKARHHESMRS